MEVALLKKHLDEQIDQLLSMSGITEHYDWTIEVETTVYITMHPKKYPDKKFTAKLKCDRYPMRAPSFQFIDNNTKNEGAQSWPQGSPFQAAVSRNQALPQLCIAGIREFHEGCHAGDAAKPWIPEKYPFVKTLEAIQVELDKAYP